MESQFTVSANHPCLEGHFPDNPIVPGVVILDEIIQTIKSHWPEKVVSSISAVKFIKPLRAEQKVKLTINANDHTTMKFICVHSGEVYVTGQCKVCDKEVT